jgi:hypothetical protein
MAKKTAKERQAMLEAQAKFFRLIALAFHGDFMGTIGDDAREDPLTFTVRVEYLLKQAAKEGA